MGECIIPMRSRTEAEKGRRAAVRAGIPTETVSVDPSLTRHGCSVGLRVACMNVHALESVLDRNGIRHGDIMGRRI